MTAVPLVEEHAIEHLHGTIEALQQALERGEHERNLLVRSLAAFRRSRNEVSPAKLTSKENEQPADVSGARPRKQSISKPPMSYAMHADPMQGRYVGPAADNMPPSSHANDNGARYGGQWKLTYKMDDDVEPVTLSRYKELVSDNRAIKLHVESLQREARRHQSEAENRERLCQKRLSEAMETTAIYQQKCRSLEAELKALTLTTKGKTIR